MKPLLHKSQSNEKLTTKNKTKIIKLDKKPNQILKSDYARDEIPRPGNAI